MLARMLRRHGLVLLLLSEARGGGGEEMGEVMTEA